MYSDRCSNSIETGVPPGLSIHRTPADLLRLFEGSFKESSSLLIPLPLPPHASPMTALVAQRERGTFGSTNTFCAVRAA